MVRTLYHRHCIIGPFAERGDVFGCAITVGTDQLFQNTLHERVLLNLLVATTKFIAQVQQVVPKRGKQGKKQARTSRVTRVLAKVLGDHRLP